MADETKRVLYGVLYTTEQLKERGVDPSKFVPIPRAQSGDKNDG